MPDLFLWCGLTTLTPVLCFCIGMRWGQWPRSSVLGQACEQVWSVARARLTLLLQSCMYLVWLMHGVSIATGA